MIKQLVIASAWLLMSATSFAGGPDHSVPPTSLTSPKQLHSRCFSSINVDGPVRVELRSIKGSRCYQSQVTRGNASSVQTFVNGNTLFVKSNNRAAKVIVYTQPISQIRAYNSAIVSSKQFSDRRPLSLTVTSNASVQLSGRYNVASIVQQSTQPISVQWVDSDTLTVNGYGDGTVTLAGVAHQLRAKLYNSNKLNAEFLRANTVLVRTHNNACAKVAATDNLRAFAHDESNIYFYKQPKQITRQSTGSANVLQLGWNQ